MTVPVLNRILTNFCTKINAKYPTTNLTNFNLDSGQHYHISVVSFSTHLATLISINTFLDIHKEVQKCWTDSQNKNLELAEINLAP